jgi:hypothetical protein
VRRGRGAGAGLGRSLDPLVILINMYKNRDAIFQILLSMFEGYGVRDTSWTIHWGIGGSTCQNTKVRRAEFNGEADGGAWKKFIDPLIL